MWLKNVYYIAGNTPFVSAGQKKTPSIRRENDTNLDTRYTYPIRVSSASESPTVEASIYTTENDFSAQEQHDYNQQGSSIILCHTFSPNIKLHWIKLLRSQVCMRFIYLKILNSNWFWFFCQVEHIYYIIKVPF